MREGAVSKFVMTAVGSVVLLLEGTGSRQKESDPALGVLRELRRLWESNFIRTQGHRQDFLSMGCKPP